MSILIKGLALPNNCHMCFFGFGGFCDVAPAEEDGICPPQGRPTWCPLIEVKPNHGRLIDGDALYKSIEADDEAVIGHVTFKDRVLLNVRGMPTIIKAEVKDGGTD